jgi:MFS family permease
MNPVPSPSVKNSGSIFTDVTFYHWMVVIIASCGWLFDCMDQRLFILARESALREVLGDHAAAQAQIKTYIGLATACMMVGWAVGGIIFGMMSDKVGRVKTMIATLLVYSGFTGLSGTSQSWIDFTVYRFLVGLGVGGMFGAATTLVAESVPGQFRAVALGSLQALSAMGNITGSAISYWIPPGEANMLAGLAGWRVLFFVGIIPSLLVVPIIFVLREPDKWLQAKAEAAAGRSAGKNVGSPADLFVDKRWRRSTIVGLLLGLSGMIGLWGIGFFSPELITTALKDTPMQWEQLQDPNRLAATLRTSEDAAVLRIKTQMPSDALSIVESLAARSAADLPPAERDILVSGLNTVIRGPSLYEEAVFAGISLDTSTVNLASKVREAAEEGDIAFLNRRLVEQTFPDTLQSIQSYIDSVRAKGTALQDAGAFLGMLTFTFVASYFSRRAAFLGAFLLCLVTTMFVFYSLNSASDAYWMLPMMGFAQLAVFAGYSIYFPELFPTRLRGTGVGFCYNTVRILAAPFPWLLGHLSTLMNFRTAAVLMASIYLLGAVALIWAPETKGQPLPED